jgi:hypothetical protein
MKVLIVFVPQSLYTDLAAVTGALCARVLVGN